MVKITQMDLNQQHPPRSAWCHTLYYCTTIIVAKNRAYVRILGFLVTLVSKVVIILFLSCLVTSLADYVLVLLEQADVLPITEYMVTSACWY